MHSQSVLIINKSINLYACSVGSILKMKMRTKIEASKCVSITKIKYEH